MTLLAPTQKSPPADATAGSRSSSGGNLAFTTEWLDARRVRIGVAGEIDAVNLTELPEYVFRRAANSRTLVFDLREVTFFAVDGFHALQVIVNRCAHADVELELLPSAAVSRVLSLCDPDQTMAGSAAA